MTNAYGLTTKLFSTPYLTLDEYKQAPTAIDYNNLVAASTDPSVQDAELANVIARASSWVDVYCNQVIGATLETEQSRARLRSDGMLIIHPRYFPIVAVTALSYGTMPNDLVAYPDLSNGWVEDQQFVLPYTAGNITFSSKGPLQFGMPAIPRAGVFVSMTYVSGYSNTVLSANVSAGASSITVKDPAGIIAGARLNVYDSLYSEPITVASSYTFGSSTVPLTSPLTSAHASGVSVSALPPAVKEATILATTAMLKVRGDNSMVMQVTNQAGTSSPESQRIGEDLALAQELLKPFRRIR